VAITNYSTDLDFKFETLQSIDQYNDFVSCPKSKNTVVNIFHLNIQSLRSNFEELKLLLVDVLDKIDIIVLTETWISDCEIDFYLLDNFMSYNCSRSYNRSGGVVVYIKNKLEFSRSVYCMISAEVIVLYCKSLDFTIISIYRSHAYSVNTFNNELSQLLQLISSKNVFLVGDINIDIIQPINNADDYIDLLHENGFISLISDVTRQRSNTCVDHMFFRTTQFETISIFPARVISGTTDHFPTVCRIVFNSKNFTFPFL